MIIKNIINLPTEGFKTTDPYVFFNILSDYYRTNKSGN